MTFKKKKSAKRGGNTSTPEVEVLNISTRGFWLLAKAHEYFLPFDRFPWFKNAKVSDICAVKLLHGYHLYWPKLYVDLKLMSLGKEENYPLIYH
jgi:hypothetical protein